MRVSRRQLLGAGAVVAAAATAYGVRDFRLSTRPKRYPDLQGSALAAARDSLQQTAPPRLMVIGNSATIRSGFFDSLTTLAQAAEPTLTLHRASAHGARLAESLRIAALRQLLRDIDWRVLVLQDFSTTPLRRTDRMASLVAIRSLARLARPASIVLLPHWPSAPGHAVYTGGAGRRGYTPRNMADYAQRSQEHYDFAARITGGVVAPVLETWLTAHAAGRDLYDDDLHHANQAGALLAATAVWETVRDSALRPSHAA